MALPLILLILALPLLVAVGIALLILAVVRPEVTGLDRRQLGVRWAGIALGLLAAALLLGAWDIPGRLGLGALAGTAPLLGAAVLIAVVLVGERRLAGPLRSTRHASLRPHGAVEVLPRFTTAFTMVAVAGLVMLMISASLLASPDDAGRPGRAIAATVAGADGQSITHAAGPYPGTWTTIPAGVALLLLCTLAALALHSIVSRRTASDPDDLLLRRRSAVAVLGAVLLGVGMLGLVLAGTAILISDDVEQAIAAAGAPLPEGWAGAAVLGPVVMVMSAIAVPWGLVLVVAPSLLAGRDRDRRAPITAPLGEGARR